MPTINIIDNNRNMSTTSAGGGFPQMGAGAIPGMMQGMPMGQTMAQQGMPMMGSGMQMPMG